MPLSASASFFSATPVFNRTGYAAAVGRGPDDPAVEAALARHVQAGDIKHVAEDVFASVPEFADARSWPADRFLVASRLRHGAVIAYHSALDLHGCAYTSGHGVHAVAPGRPSVVKADGFLYRFMEPPRGLALEDGRAADGVTVVDYMGIEVQVTTIERTIVDLFGRHDLAGDTEDFVNSLDLVMEIDADALARHARALGDPTAAGALGHWLERKQGWFGLGPAALEGLRALAPTQPRHALGARPGEGRLAADWNVILPVEAAEPRFQGMDPDLEGV